jgi:hypothetical protein
MGLPIGVLKGRQSAGIDRAIARVGGGSGLPVGCSNADNLPD